MYHSDTKSCTGTVGFSLLNLKNHIASAALSANFLKTMQRLIDGSAQLEDLR